MDTKFSRPSMGLGSALIRQKGWALVGDCLGTSLTLDERLSLSWRAMSHGIHMRMREGENRSAGPLIASCLHVLG